MPFHHRNLSFGAIPAQSGLTSAKPQATGQSDEIIFLTPDDEGITFLEPTRSLRSPKTSPADVEAFRRRWMPHLQQTGKFSAPRAEVVRAVEECTDLKILDFGNTQDWELGYLLLRLVAYPQSVPKDVGYLLVGHGVGKNAHWTFEGTRTRVADYIQKHVPSGASVWACVCESGKPRNLAMAEGVRLECIKD